MPRIVVEELTPRRENDLEHEVAFRWGGRRLVARVILDAGERTDWAEGTSHDVEIRLVRSGKVAKMAPGMRPGLDDEGDAMWRAIGPVLAMDGEIATVDVGFPLAIDLDALGAPLPELTAGDSLAVRGELRVAPPDP